MLNYIKNEANMTHTENGAVTHESTLSSCLDLFAVIGALRRESDGAIIDRFIKAYAEDADIAMKTLFFARDVRGGLGERRVFRVIVNWLAKHEPESLRKTVALIPEYGRFDDLLSLIGTACEEDALNVIKTQLERDMESREDVSLLAKWLPSVNASSLKTVLTAKHIAKSLGMTDAEYRRALSALRAKIRIIENNLRERDYTFDYSKQPSRAMFKYRKAFIRNDGERYGEFLEAVKSGERKMNTGTLMPYDIVSSCLNGYWNDTPALTGEERESLDVSWRALENFAGNENALVVADGSGSMYSQNDPMPAAVALSLAIYFAERNTGAFKNHFITFSSRTRLVEVRGKDIYERVRYCTRYNDVANTNLERVFKVILNAAVKNHVPASELPKRIYIISDMEFDICVENAGMTNFENAKKLFAERGYELPEVVFWNVAARTTQQPVTKNEQGVALVSGCTPRLFSMVAEGELSPYKVMMEILSSERYAAISA